MIESKALEVNIADYYVDVAIDEKYSILQDVMSTYYGLMEGLNTFLKELSHPYKNWQFIVKEARGYALDYFHLFRHHPKGCEAAVLLADIFFDAFERADNTGVRTDAADNLLLFLQKILKDSGPDLQKFMPLIDDVFHRIRNYSNEDFFLFNS